MQRRPLGLRPPVRSLAAAPRRSDTPPLPARRSSPPPPSERHAPAILVRPAGPFGRAPRKHGPQTDQQGEPRPAEALRPAPPRPASLSSPPLRPAPLVYVTGEGGLAVGGAPPTCTCDLPSPRRRPSREATFPFDVTHPPLLEEMVASPFRLVAIHFMYSCDSVFSRCAPSSRSRLDSVLAAIDKTPNRTKKVAAEAGTRPDTSSGTDFDHVFDFSRFPCSPRFRFSSSFPFARSRLDGHARLAQNSRCAICPRKFAKISVLIRIFLNPSHDARQDLDDPQFFHFFARTSKIPSVAYRDGFV